MFFIQNSKKHKKNIVDCSILPICDRFCIIIANLYQFQSKRQRERTLINTSSNIKKEHSSMVGVSDIASKAIKYNAFQTHPNASIKTFGSERPRIRIGDPFHSDRRPISFGCMTPRIRLFFNMRTNILHKTSKPVFTHFIATTRHCHSPSEKTQA